MGLDLVLKGGGKGGLIDVLGSSNTVAVKCIAVLASRAGVAASN